MRWTGATKLQREGARSCERAWVSLALGRREVLVVTDLGIDPLARDEMRQDSVDSRDGDGGDGPGWDAAGDCEADVGWESVGRKR